MNHEPLQSEPEVLPAPVLDESVFRTVPAFPPPRPVGNPELEQEYEAFLRLYPELLKTHYNCYVAVHQGKVVESGDDAVSVARHAYRKCGYVPIYINLVTDQPRRVERLPSSHTPRSAVPA